MAVYVNPNQENNNNNNSKKITASQQQSSVTAAKNPRSYEKFPKALWENNSPLL